MGRMDWLLGASVGAFNRELAGIRGITAVVR